MKKTSTVILAAGKSSRFKSKNSKIFQNLAGISIIEHIYNLAIKIPNNDIIFVCNNENITELKKKFVNSKFVIQKKQNGTADAINCAKKFIKNTNLLILFGDVPLISFNTIKKLIKNYIKNKCIGSMIAFNAKDPYAYGRVKVKNRKVISVVEEINASQSDISASNITEESVDEVVAEPENEPEPEPEPEPENEPEPEPEPANEVVANEVVANEVVPEPVKNASDTPCNA